MNPTGPFVNIARKIHTGSSTPSRRFPSPDDLRHVKIMKNVWTIEE